MASEIAQCAGVIAFGVGCLATFATFVGISNGHVFTNLFEMAWHGPDMATGVFGILGLVDAGLMGVGMIAIGACKTKKAWDEYKKTLNNKDEIHSL